MRLRIIHLLALLCLSAGMSFGQTLTTLPNPSTVGQAVTLTANPVNSGSSVTFYDGGAPPAGTIIASSINNGPSTGPVSVQVSTLSAGLHQLVACVPSSPSPACSTAVGQQVNPAPAPLVLTSSPNPSDFGQAVTLSAGPTPGATVFFYDGGSTAGTVIGSGSSDIPAVPVMIQVSTLSAGTHQLIACYTAGSPTPTCSNIVSQQVNSGSPSATLTSNNNPSFEGEAVTFTANPIPGPTTVFFDEGAACPSQPCTQLGSAQAPAGAGSPVSFTISTLTSGPPRQITACFSPPSGSFGCTNFVNQQITGRLPLIVTPNPNPSTVGQTVTITASAVTGADPVNFYDAGGSVFLGSATPGPPSTATVSIQVSNLSLGQHNIIACYNIALPQTCSSPVAQQVITPPPALTLSSTPNPSTFGRPVTLTANPVPSSTTVTFYDGGVGGTVIGSGLGPTNAGQGPVSIQVSNLSVGNHQLIACYLVSSNSFVSNPMVCSNTASQQVNPISTSLTLTSSLNPSSPCQPVTFTASISPPNATGSVTFLDGTSTLGTVPLSAGTASLTLPSFTLGTHQVQARYVPDPGYGGSSSALAQTVTASATVTLSSAPNPSSSGQTVTMTATVAPAACPGTAPPTTAPTGTVSFLDGGIQIGQSFLAAGTATFSTSTLAVGNHTLGAQYNGDTNYSPISSNTVTQVVGGGKPTTTTLTTSANPILTTQSLTLTATVAPSGTPGPTSPTGSVQFKDGATVIGTSPLIGGTATLTISNLPAGAHPLTAVYLGDSNFNTSTSSTVNETVNAPGTTATTLTTSTNPISTTQSLTLTATVTPPAPAGPTGQVQFKDGPTVIGTSPLSGGTATLTISNLTAGTHPLTAVYLGDSSFNTSTSNTVSETVNPPGTTTLTSSPNPSTAGQAVTLTASPVPGGSSTVTFYDGGPNGTVIGSAAAPPSGATGGPVTIQVSTLSLGTHQLIACYLFSGPPATCTNTVTQVVNKTNTTTGLSTSSNPVPSGQPLTLTAVVLPAGATGQVQFSDNGSTLGTVTLSNGAASFTTSTLSIGNHGLAASYLGDANFNPSASPTANQAVTQATSISTTTTLSVFPNPASLGQAVTLNAVVTPVSGTGPVSGTVTFNDNGSALATAQLLNGTALFTTSSLAAGSHTIVAVYGGSTTFNSSSSTPVTLVVNGRPTQTTLSASPNPATFGQPVLLNASVAPVTGGGTPTGTVTFSDGNTTLGTATPTAGGASFSTSALTVGAHSLIASYSGDSTFNQSSSLPVSLQVNKATTTTVAAVAPPSSNPGQAVQLSARVTPATATGSITFMDGTTAIGAPVVLVGGIASTITSSLTVGNHSVTAVYGGDANFLGSTSAPVIESVGTAPPTPTTTGLSVIPTTSSFGQAVTLTATVAPSGATGTVNFMEGTATIGSQILNGGIATFTTASLGAGIRSLSAVYSGDTVFATSTSPLVTETVTNGNSSTVLSVSPNPATVGKQVTLSAIVTPLPATGTVTFFDSGTTLGSGTLSNGTATFSITTLAVGSHSLTASFPGDVNNNGSTSSAVAEVVNAACAPLGTISPTALTNAIVGSFYSQTFTVAFGCVPLTWSLTSGSVPGLSLSAAGVLSGTPTTATTNPVPLTVRVQDSSSPTSATATVLSLTVLAAPAPSITVTQPSTLTDQPAPQFTLSPPYPLALSATFSLTFTSNAANLPANYINPDVKFIGGSTTAGPFTIPANSSAAMLLPAIQLGTVAGTITVSLATLTTSAGQSVLPANPVTTTIAVGRFAPTIVPGSVKIVNITSTGFSVFLDGTSTPRDLTSASLTFTAASGDQLNGTQFTVSLTAAATAWFSDTGANRGVANGGAFSLTLPFNYSGDTTAIGTVSVTVTNSVGTSGAVSGGR